MGKIVLRRFTKPEALTSKVIRVDGDIYESLLDISDKTSISIQKLTSVLLKAAIDEVVIIDNDESEEEK